MSDFVNQIQSDEINEPTQEQIIELMREAAEMETMKNYDVTYVNPFDGEVTAKNVSQEKLKQNESGELVYRFNSIFPECEVITTVEVETETNYFNQYGTANE